MLGIVITQIGYLMASVYNHDLSAHVNDRSNLSSKKILHPCQPHEEPTRG